jgi:hypothetical protein
MGVRIAPKETYEWLKYYFRRRADIGIRKAIMDVVLNPRNPLEPEARRSPKPGFVFGACLFIFAAAWFLYFNFAR